MHGSIKHVGIIGAGELGQALGRAFRRADVRVKFYDTQTERSEVGSVAELLHFSRTVFLCSPSWANRSIAEELVRAAGSEQCMVVCFSKGVEGGFVTMDRVLEAHLGGKHLYGLAYGPMIAEELAVGRQASAVVALSDMSSYDRLSELLAKAKIVCEPSSDLQGLGIVGVLKNVYAIAFGMSDGLMLGANAKGKLVVMVLREMKQLLLHFEADPELAEGLAGLGDLVTTGITDASFNYRVGKTIAQGIADEKIKSEGLNTLKELSHKVDASAYPLLGVLDKIVHHHLPAGQLDQLLSGKA
ncbi:MAG TPA: NAD(P)H-dependent glycerol-3-phosphate dehydrogenase [Candidatus Acidoferrum sp.]|nr:NAD(P)H-dependent glycerol-3-phosphate dehydrogenase [Candidatus Acidoferrum sp.]